MDGYKRLARELTDYIATCNAHRRVPLKHDVNYYTARPHKAEKDERKAMQLEIPVRSVDQWIGGVA